MCHYYIPHYRKDCLMRPQLGRRSIGQLAILLIMCGCCAICCSEPAFAAHEDFTCSCVGLGSGQLVNVNLSYLGAGKRCDMVYLSTVTFDQHGHLCPYTDPNPHEVCPHKPTSTTVAYCTTGLVSGDEFTVEVIGSGNFYDHICCSLSVAGNQAASAAKRNSTPPDFSFTGGSVVETNTNQFNVAYTLAATPDTPSSGTRVSVYRIVFKRDSSTGQLTNLTPLENVYTDDHLTAQNIGIHANTVTIPVDCSAAVGAEVWVKVLAVSSNTTVRRRTRVQ